MAQKNDKTMNEVELKNTVIDALEDIKGIDILALDVGHLTDVTDHLIIASGASNRQVKALADSVLMKCKEQNERAIGIEGLDQSEWVLLDYGIVVVHIMLPDTREFYDLERLWDMAASSRAS
jgi:ribosome-associated protein|tara:strand:+ start:19990 stop:20355 length:366 start_codon:yes stop_codon:yes gene_type:complete